MLELVGLHNQGIRLEVGRLLCESANDLLRIQLEHHRITVENVLPVAGQLDDCRIVPMTGILSLGWVY